MFRTVAAKALILIVIATAGFVAVCCLLLYSGMKGDQIEESILHANDISSVMLKATRFAMLKEDRESLRNIVKSVSEESLVEHVRIFNKKGVIVFSGEEGDVGRGVDVNTEGCSVCHAGAKPVKTLGPMEQARRFVSDKGEPVLATTSAIYNEPKCSDAAACHYHPANQAILGTLDIGLSEEPLRRSLAVMGKRLFVFSAMLLILVTGGVAALLQMNVARPLRQMVDYLHAVSSGEGKAVPPALEGEMDAIIREVQRTKRRANGRD